jgi:hypothetical protein
VTEDHAGPGSDQAAQPPEQNRLRLQRDHSGAETGESAGPVTQMGADVEDHGIWWQKCPVEASQTGLTSGSPVDHQRTQDADEALPVHSRQANKGCIGQNGVCAD